jgi:hypothetical protein
VHVTATTCLQVALPKQAYHRHHFGTK